MSPTKLIRRRARAASATLAVLTIAAAAGACSSPTSADDGKDKQLVIGLAEALTSVPFLATLDGAFKDQAEKLGMKVDIRDGEYKNEKMIENINQFINQKVDLIVVVPTDPKALNPVIKKANEAGIPVFTVNAKVDAGPKIDLHVGASEEDFGTGLGKLLVEAAPTGGKYALLTGPAGSVPQVGRSKGMDNVLAPLGSKYENVATRPIDGWAKDKALAEIQDLLTKYPKGSLAAVVCQGPMCVTGAKYAKDNGRADVKFILGDYPTEVRDAITAGTVFGTVNQSPKEQGSKAAEFAHEWLAGDKSKVPSPEFKTGLPLITKSNAAATPAEFS
jgi:ABC-type sugar transport system substrate-binding protein